MTLLAFFQSQLARIGLYLKPSSVHAPGPRKPSMSAQERE